MQQFVASCGRLFDSQRVVCMHMDPCTWGYAGHGPTGKFLVLLALSCCDARAP